MCFNATSSFVAAAILVPAGILASQSARHGDGRYRLLAAFPLLFGIQQSLEGLLWLELAEGVSIDLQGMAQAGALAFLFFAYFLWPCLVPLAASQLEPQRWRRRLFATTAVLGGLLGASLFLPLVVNPDWIQVTLIRGSILYHPRMIHDPYLYREFGRALYALVVTLPLIMSSDTMVRQFGALIIASMIVSAMAFGYAFVSIWCFFAALLSVYLALRLPAQIANCPRPVYS
jgi:hypothetical protein